MKLLDILHEPWAITPDKKREIDAIYAKHLRGEKIDIAGIEGALGRPLVNVAPTYELRDGVAVLDFTGVMGKRMNLFLRISGGFSTQMATALVQQAAADPAVQAMLIVMDSPGGSVDGTSEFADAVRTAAEQKPVAVVADGMMASAAYWVGSAASAVYAANGSTFVGSIGVVATHVDVSGAEAQMGVKTTEITAGKFKRIASEYGPLSESGRQSIQDQVDYIYGQFLDAVAQHRGVASREAVHTQMADGRIFIGQQAVDAGLVDGIASQDAVLAMLAGGQIPLRPLPGRSAAVPARAMPHAVAGAAADPTTTQETSLMNDPQKVTAEQAQPFVDAAVAKAKTEFDATAPTLRKAGADGERERIRSVFAQAMPGHEALIQTLAFDGTTTGPEAAVQVLAAERAKKAKVATDLKADAPAPVPAAAAPAPEPVKEPAVIDPTALAQKARAYQAEQKKLGITVSAAEAVRHVTAEAK